MPRSALFMSLGLALLSAMAGAPAPAAPPSARAGGDGAGMVPRVGVLPSSGRREPAAPAPARLPAASARPGDAATPAAHGAPAEQGTVHFVLDAEDLAATDFAALDADGDGYIDESERREVDTFQEFRFHHLDADADGRVSRREFAAWVARQREAREMDATP